MEKQGKQIKKFWVVKDPGPSSELGDIMFESDINEFAAYCLGSGTWKYFKSENHVMYDSSAEAKKDAEARMKAQQKTAGLVKRVASRACRGSQS